MVAIALLALRGALAETVFEGALEDGRTAPVPGMEVSCREPGGWRFRIEREAVEKDLEIFRFRLTNAADAVPPVFEVKFTFPAVDMPHLWKSEYAYDGVRPNWTSADCRKSETSYAWWTPVYALHNATDRNRAAIATSECVRPVVFRPWLREEDLTCGFRFSYFTEKEAPLREYAMAIRLDRRDVFYGDAISSASEWILAERGEKPAISPADAFRPFYSSWYSFHQNVFDHELEAECAEAAKLGMKAIIVDDGWQTDDTSRGYAFCGDWEISKNRFPDMKAHVAKVHALGMKYLMWYSMPSVGTKSAAYAKFRGKYLSETDNEATFDPRFPEVRAYLADIYARAMKEWDLDGFKLDFINSFSLWGKPDPAEKENWKGRDIRSLHEAIDALVAESVRRIREVKPEALIEFRQTYIGPAVRKYGNLFRVADCCGVFAANRAGIAALRLVCGRNAVHSDMIAWNPAETAESASRQILDSIFGTVQYSMRLKTLPAEHRRMMAHWIEFSRRHEEALQHGAFRAHHPELQYPVIEGESAAERVIGVYVDTMVVDTGAPDRDVYVLNATGAGRVNLKLAAPAKAEVFDTFGECVVTLPLAAGLNEASVPPGGYLRIVR